MKRRRTSTIFLTLSLLLVLLCTLAGIAPVLGQCVPKSFSNKTTANGLGDNGVFGVFASGSTVYAATNGGLALGSCNSAPAITAMAQTVTAGSLPAQNLPIATVSDTDQAANTLTVTVTSANPTNGVTLSNLTNTDGNVTADVTATCTATTSTFT